MTRRRWRARTTRATRTLGRVLIAFGLAAVCIFDADVSAYADTGVYSIGPSPSTFYSPSPPPARVSGSPSSLASTYGWAYSATGFEQDPLTICNNGPTWQGAVVIQQGGGQSGGGSGSQTGLTVSCSAGATNGWILGLALDQSTRFGQSVMTQLGCAAVQANGYSGCLYTQVVSFIKTEYDYTAQGNGGGTVGQPQPFGPCSSNAFSALGSLTTSSDGTADLLSIRLTTAAGQAPPSAGWRVDSPVPPVSGGQQTFPGTPVGYMGAGDLVAGSNNVYYHQYTLILPGQAPTVVTAADGTTVKEVQVTALSSRSPVTPLCAVVVPLSNTLLTATGGGAGSGGSTDASCGFSLNLLHDVECALCQAFCPGSAATDALTSVKDSFAATAPGSVIINGFTFITDLVTQLNTYQYNGVCSQQGVTCANSFGQAGPPTDPDGHQLDIVGALDGQPWLHITNDFLSASIYVGGVFIIWRQWRSRFGSPT